MFTTTAGVMEDGTIGVGTIGVGTVGTVQVLDWDGTVGMVQVSDWDGTTGMAQVGVTMAVGMGTIGVGTTIGMVITTPTLMEEETLEFIIITALEELQVTALIEI